MGTGTLFADAPEDLGALDNEALTDLLASFRDVSARLRAGEVDLAEVYGADVPRAEATERMLAEWRSAGETAQRIRDIIAERGEAEARFAAEAEALDAAFVTAEADAPVAEAVDAEVEALAADTDEPEVAEVEEVEEPEAVVASADAPTPRPVLYPVPAAARIEVREADRPRSALLASAGLYDTPQGTPLDRLGLADALIAEAKRRGPVQHVKGGGPERIPIARASLAFSEEMTLRRGDTEGNLRKIKAIGSPYFGADEMETLLASGGICAPPTPFYDVPSVSVTDRPVRDSLAGFLAERGAVSVPSVSTIGDIDEAITVIEADEDALGGTFATKSKQAMDCATWTDVAVGAIAHRREYGNLNARTWPEGIAHENAVTMAAWARTAEGRLLDRIDALSRSVTRAAVYGASSTLLYALQVSRVGIISRLRMNPRTRFNVILPFWAAEMFSLDLVNSQYGRFDTPPEQVGALLSRFGFNVTWHLDEGIDGSATAEIFEAQGTGEQVDWPGTQVVARLAPAGQFLYLDGGSLDFGLIRDSTLNETNDHEVFGESFENVARIGPAEAGHRIAITVCPDGTVAAPADAFACSAS